MIAGCFALSAFTVAIIAGVAGANSAFDVVWRALLAMLLCYPVGYVVGMLCERTVDDHIKSTTAAAHHAAVPATNEAVRPASETHSPRSEKEALNA